VWILNSILETNSNVNDGFGATVSLSGSLLVVGNNSPSASVWLFENKNGTDWTRTNIFSINGVFRTEIESCSFCEISQDISYGESSGQLGTFATNSMSYFGKSVKVRNNKIYIGEPYSLTFNPYSGSSDSYNVGTVYCFEKKQFKVSNDIDCRVETSASIDVCGWDYIGNLYEPVGYKLKSNYFGYSIACDDRYLAVGSIYGSPYSIARYIPVYNEWDIENYVPESSGPRDYSYLQGKTFVFDLDANFKLVSQIYKQKEKNTPLKRFSNSVTVDNNRIVVGAPTYVYGEIYNGETITSEETQSFVDEDGGDDYFITEPTSPGNFAPYSYDIDKLVTIPNNVKGSVFVYDLTDYDTSAYVGNVFYKNGLFVVTNTSSIFQNMFQGEGSKGYEIKFKSTHTIFENEVICPVFPGEFNVSTNPTSVYREEIPMDINKDGIFDLTDLDIILQYMYKYKIKMRENVREDDGGIITEQENDGEDSWWGDDIIMTESEDALLLSLVDVVPVVSLVEQYNTALVDLDSRGILDINGDGVVDINDAKILINYYKVIRN
jgi:hypothetical protein